MSISTRDIESDEMLWSERFDAVLVMLVGKP